MAISKSLLAPNFHETVKLYTKTLSHIVPELFEGTWWSSHSVMYFFGSSGAKDQLPGH